jgi:tRNA threonylcarbamoyladenosine biosynthesis protein TsaB
MKILALEFSSEQRSVAIFDTVQPERLGLASEFGGRSTHAFGLIESALQRAKLDREQIESIAVGLGPGSYTGIRVAISVAQGWQLARGVRVLGVSSVECLLARAIAEGISGRVCFALDAQRSEFYVATYEIAAANARVAESLRLVGEQEVKSRLARGEVVLGPEIDRLNPGARPLFPDAATLARLAAPCEDSVSAGLLEPIYLRQTAYVKAPPPRIVSGSQ